MDGFGQSDADCSTYDKGRRKLYVDYILDTEGYIESLSFVNIKTKEQA